MKIDTNTEQGLANENVFILNTFAFSSDGRFFYYLISEKRQIDVHFCLIAFFLSACCCFCFVSLQSANNYRLRINSAQFNFRLRKKGLLASPRTNKINTCNKPIENKLNRKFNKHNTKKTTTAAALTLQRTFICWMMSLNRKSDCYKLICVHL